MPTRRELLIFTLASTVSPWSLMQAGSMQNKLVPYMQVDRELKLSNIDYKAYLLLAAKKAHEYFDIHKVELLQYALIILALSLILAVGIPPTKELILYLVL